MEPDSRSIDAALDDAWALVAQLREITEGLEEAVQRARKKDEDARPDE